MSHVIMKKTLAKALMDAGMENYAGGGLIGGLSNFLGTSNDFQAAGADNGALINEQHANQNQVYGQQQALAQQLLAQTQGQGPGQQLIAQQAGQLGAQQGALMASARGASANPALIARQAAMMGAQGQQQALNAQAGLQLQSQNALGNQYAQMANQSLQGQSIAQGAIAAQNQVNAGVAAGNQATNKGLLGGLLGGLSGGLLAHGGEVKKMAMGGVAPLMGIQQYGGGMQMPMQGGADPLQSALGGLAGKGLKAAFAGPQLPVSGPGSAEDMQSGGLLTLGAQQQENQMSGLPLYPSAGFASGGKIPFGQMLAGGNVPGEAQVKGDSEENDTVPTLLSPGEVVIPRSIAQHPDAPEKAAEFIRHLKSKKKMGYGGVVEARRKK
jgi:hypothetical protein